MTIPKHRVLVLKMDNKEHYEWHPQLIWSDEDFRMTAWAAPRDLQHHSKSSVFTFDNNAIEIFWRNAPFSIGLSYDKTSQDLKYYCNIHLPCTMENDQTSFIDLDLDVIKENLEPSKTIDYDEFETHQKQYNYNKDIVAKAPSIAKKLESLLNEKAELQPEALKALFHHVFKNKTLTNCSTDRIKPYRDLINGWPKELFFII